VLDPTAALVDNFRWPAEETGLIEVVLMIRKVKKRRLKIEVKNTRYRKEEGDLVKHQRYPNKKPQ